MKKYFAIIIFTITIAILIQTVYHKEPTEWIESCYGINCVGYTAEPSPPREDWGWSNDYCSKYYWRQVENITELHELVEPDCYI